MNTILVVDDMPICREPIEAALRHAGYQTLGASSGQEALALLNQTRPDLMLLDVRMPDLDGMAVLRAMRRNPSLNHVKVILLTEVADRDHILEAARLGAAGYLLKSRFSLETMLSRLKEALEPPANAAPAAVETARPEQRSSPASGSAPASSKPAAVVDRAVQVAELTPTIRKDELIRLVNEGLELRPLGPAVRNVMNIACSAHSNAEELAEAVAKDQALAVRVLRVANSSVYARGRQADSLKTAVSRVGTQEVRNLVIALEVTNQFTGRISERIDARLFWEHSIGCGLIASRLARSLDWKNHEDCFLWGILHDVGRLILLEIVPDKYLEALDAAESLDLPLEAVEPKLLVLDHCAILEQALTHWRFPRELIASVVSHHRSIRQIQRVGPQVLRPAALVALANRLAHALLLGSSGNDVLYPIFELSETLGLRAGALETLLDSIADETNDLKFSMLVHANSTDWPDFRSRMREELARPLRALCVSAQTELDVYRIFCEQLAEVSDDGPQNLGLIYLHDARAAGELMEAYQAREQAEGAPGLPMVIICEKGQPDLDSWIQDRPYAVLRAPVRMASLIKTINGLLNHQA